MKSSDTFIQHMKYFIILLALGFQIACSNDNKSDDSKKNKEGSAHTNSSEQDLQAIKTNDSINIRSLPLDKLRKLADQGHADAQHRLAFIYYYGYDVSQDYAQAFIWYKKLADQDDAIAQTYLGLMYEFGRGVDKNYNQAFDLFKKAAVQDNVYAQRSLSGMYKRGLGVEQNDKLASFWMRESEKKR